MNTSVPGAALVFGAGAVACWVGGSLAAAGLPVAFVGRPRVLEALRTHGLTLSDLDGCTRRLEPAALHLASAVPEGAAPALVLLCVKSGDTAAAARTLAQALPPRTPVLSLQNGIANCATARQHANALTLIPGVVGFNIAQVAPGHYHRGTSGLLAAQNHPALHAWQRNFAAAGMPLQLHADLAPLQWGKLLLNLNNPVNALSGLPLRAELLQRDYRVCLAALIAEALGVLRATGIRPQRLAPLPPAALPAVLKLPTPLFRLLAARMLRIDAQARSSMADDLARGRATEIDAICGEIVRLARSRGAGAPLAERISELVRGWPQDPRPRAGAELRAALGLR